MSSVTLNGDRDRGYALMPNDNFSDPLFEVPVSTDRILRGAALDNFALNGAWTLWSSMFLLMNNAWAVWTSLARSGSMGTTEDRSRMLKRHEIVVRIIDVNSRRLRIENEINGLDIYDRVAKRDLSEDSVNDARRNDLEEFKSSNAARMAELRQERDRLEHERLWLDQTLAEFDGTPESDAIKIGNA